MPILNYLYFLVFLWIGFKGVMSPTQMLTYNNVGVSKEFEVRRGNFLIYYLIITSLFAFYAPGLVDLAAIRLMMTMVIFMLMLALWGKGVRFTLGIGFYCFFIWWAIFGIMYSGYSSAYGVRTVLKYCYPLLLFFVTSTFIQNEDLVKKISIDVRRIALFSLGVFFIPYVSYLFKGVFYYGTAVAIHYISISAISLAWYFLIERSKKNLVFAFLFMLPCIVWVFRTSLLANVVMLSVFAIFMYKLRAVLILAFVAILGVVSIFYVPSVKEKMFFNSEQVTISDLQNGNITMDQINSNGRFAMWEDLYNRFYVPHEVVGSGTGNLQEYMYNNRVFGGLKVPHNDYITILCDNGIIGIVFFFLSYIFIFIHCYITYNDNSNSNMIKYCAIVAASTLPAVLIAMYTENTINYSMATFTLPIAFYGMMMGLKWQQNNK